MNKLLQNVRSDVPCHIPHLLHVNEEHYCRICLCCSVVMFSVNVVMFSVNVVMFSVNVVMFSVNDVVLNATFNNISVIS